MTSVLLDKKVGFISLGCDKNRVDLEKIIFQIKSSGFTIVTDIETANIIVINTCSFIKLAREESIKNILECAEYKNRANLEKIIVTGCINEMQYRDLATSLPEVDAFINIKDNNKIVKTIYNLYNIDSVEDEYAPNFGRVTTTQYYSYLKISDGCNNFCTYCTIPFIRGRYSSVPISELVAEANSLVDNGITELILVAQDVTRYGTDFADSTTLVTLIRQLSKIKKLKWIRLLYCYPESITKDLIYEIRDNQKVCKYIDMPIQHISNRILKEMNRRGTSEKICAVIEDLRKNIPNITIRSTFIVGFPGEDESDFNSICEFLKTYKLNNVGFFTYSREKGTKAYDLKPQIPKLVKDKRLKIASKIQHDVAIEHNLSLIGKTIEVLVESKTDNLAFARSQHHCPIVDGMVIMEKNVDNITLGNYYKVIITDIKNYDIKGEIIDEKLT